MMGGASVTSVSVLGPLLMTTLFVGVSVGLMETRQRARKGQEWDAYAARVPSAIIPMPPSVARLLFGEP